MEGNKFRKGVKVFINRWQKEGRVLDLHFDAKRKRWKYQIEVEGKHFEFYEYELRYCRMLNRYISSCEIIVYYYDNIVYQDEHFSAKSLVETINKIYELFPCYNGLLLFVKSNDYDFVGAWLIYQYGQSKRID